MPNDAAREIIRRAMEDRAVYDEMARRESEVWGRMLPNREANPATAADQAAAVTLGVNRGMTGIARWARENGRTFERCLSLGCGEGRFERSLVEGGVCRAAHGIDVSESAVEAARDTAAAAGLEITYAVADLNFFTIEEDAFDLVVAQTSLHHVLHLEHVMEQVCRALVPGGIFWVHDFIGESQFQYSDERMAIANAIVGILPEKYRKNKVTGRTLAPLVRRQPGTLVSPFESIRSGEIPHILAAYFDIVEKWESKTLQNLVVPLGTRIAYAESEDGRALFELIMLVDRLCQEHGILTPMGGQYVLTPKARAT